MEISQRLIVGKKTFKYSQLEDAVDLWLSINSSSKSLLIYIHGRGKEPSKTKKILPDFRSHYNTNPIVINWRPSQSASFARLQEAAEASGHALFGLLQNLAKRARPEKPLVLLTQSMGNFACEHLGRLQGEDASSLPANLVQIIVLNASPVSSKHHREWLGNLSAKSSVYVTINKYDRILKIAEKFTRYTTLGRSVDRYELADNVVYVDLVNFHNKFHRYF